MVFCGSCGADVAGKKFCGGCGAPCGDGVGAPSAPPPMAAQAQAVQPMMQQTQFAQPQTMQQGMIASPMMQAQPMQVGMMMQPGMQPQGMAQGGAPMGGLFDCFDDFGVCLCGYCCTPCLIGQTHERAGLPSGPMFKIPAIFCAGVACFYCIIGIPITCYGWSLIVKGRGTIQQLAGKPDAGCFENCCTYYCCAACASCQEANFINKRWEANGRRPLLMPGQMPGMQPRYVADMAR
jgi:Cys-rich protein (TIGR01571 family)